MQVILVRHGESEANLKGIFSGSLDVKLTEYGIKQAKECSKRIKDIHIDYAFSSDLQRAYDTAKLVLNRNIKIKKMKEFREMDFGLWEGCTYNEIKLKYPNDLDVWTEESRNKKCGEIGESRTEFYERIIFSYKKLINEIYEKNKNSRVIIFAHSGVLRVILTEELIGNIEGYWKFRIDNCSLNVLEYDEEKFCFARKINTYEKLYL